MWCGWRWLCCPANRAGSPGKGRGGGSRSGRGSPADENRPLGRASECHLGPKDFSSKRATGQRAFCIIEYSFRAAEGGPALRMSKLLTLSLGFLVFAGADIPGSERLRSSPTPGATFSATDE